MKSVQQHIGEQIRETPPGAILFPADFRGLGSDDAIRQALSRLVSEGVIERLGHGIYYLPQYDDELGKLIPSMEKIAEAIAAREHVRILPTGAAALNRLGLSTQVPMNIVYLTDGQRRNIQIGKGKLVFKPTTPKKFAFKGAISGMLIRALEDVNLNEITAEMRARIKVLIEKEDPQLLKYDLQLASAKTHDYLLQLIKDRHEVA
ncbi:Transcriptional regulator, AbiEi antitoxin, Type IV TA system [Hydrobacter penzbergensis]|uniref:Transcriptional regulator, AbiEi antitoxin, Type IV TA system n=1 Tax=Hydrobacter penzbergensis TaxID=1235997 RepID=A0A8X8IH26_9BACT|nr:DUF6088 family protein [Hydrobacter penzbergensis]SDX18534.1 Transcriptional regulator, AbiEi antitoxin, Type IV TA system [Hydrobacter penzbergensis]